MDQDRRLPLKERNQEHRRKTDEAFDRLEGQELSRAERVHYKILRLSEKSRFRFMGRAFSFVLVYAALACLWVTSPISRKPEASPFEDDVSHDLLEFEAVERRLAMENTTLLQSGRRLGVMCHEGGRDEECVTGSTLGSCIPNLGCRFGCYSAEDHADEYRSSVYFMSGDWRLTTLDCRSVHNPICTTGNGNIRRQNKECREICLQQRYMSYLPMYIIGMFYMFGGLAIVCDEFFVPSLEKFALDLKVSNDVAGATFMAAGGSMPELITSFQGTFYENDVGFATIVGSAVFNVLFVIGVCGLASDEVLILTWWPLARDVSCYLIALLTVFIVFGRNTPNVINWYEALILLGEYFAYCCMMAYNKRIQQFVFRQLGLEYVDPDEEEADSLHPSSAITMLDPTSPAAGGEPNKRNSELKEMRLDKPTTFRRGIFSLLTQNRHLSETVGMHAVTMMAGNLQQTFEKMDDDGDGYLDRPEIIKLLKKIGLRDDDDESNIENLIQELKMIAPRMPDGRISFEAFKKWYLASEARVSIEVNRVFKRFDQNQDGIIDRNEIKDMLTSLGHKPQDEEIDDAIRDVLLANPDLVKAFNMTGGDTEKGEEAKDMFRDCTITFEQFDKWYSSSLFWQGQHERHELEAEEAEEEGYSIDMPCSWPPSDNMERTAFLYWFFLYPLAAAMYVSIPDCRTKAYHTTKWAVIEFVVALMWIAGMSIMLYEWTCVTSNSVGIPTSIAAVTLIAGGTSIPDLLSSYVVAKQGHGDMAVSSSIGSNIFDVTIGLPLPWLVYIALNGKDVSVQSNSIGFSLLVLMGMLAGVIMSIIFMGWRMNKALGIIMMCLYVIYLVQHFCVEFGVFSVDF